MAPGIGTRLGPYLLTRLLGRGGMGEVYAARDERLGRDVAVKVLPAHVERDPDRLRRFEQEARLAGALNHPNVLIVHDVGASDGAPFLVSELLEGHTLRDELRSPSESEAPRGLSQARAVEIACQVAKGLAAAHERGIVHRDLKPENVFLTTDGRVKILDFGLAKLRDAPPLSASTDPAGSTQVRDITTTHTGPGMIVGTVGYMAPEQVRGESVDHRADLFALGVMLFEMLSGRRPFLGDSGVETLNAILKEPPPQLSAIGVQVVDHLERTIQHCLEKRASERFQSARDLAFHLADVVETSPSQSRLPARTGGDQERAQVQRAWLAAALAGTTAVVAVGLLVVGAFRAPAAPEAPPPAPVFSNIAAPDQVESAFGQRGFALSPNGRFLAFPGRDPAGVTLLWIRDMNTGASRPIPRTDDALFPFWSPDSAEVAVWSSKKILRIAIGPDTVQTVCELNPGFRGGAWLPDGSMLLATLSTPILKVPAAGGSPTAVTSLSSPAGSLTHRWPAPDLDGRTLFFGVVHPETAREGIYRIPADGRGEPTLEVAGAVRRAVPAVGGTLLFLKDGSLIARVSGGERRDVVLAEAVDDPQSFAGFSVSSNGRLVVQTVQPQNQVWMVSRTGVPERQVGFSTIDNFVLTNDGRVFGNPEGDPWVFDVGRGIGRRLTTSTVTEGRIALSPDGAHLAYFRGVGRAGLVLHDLRTGREDVHDIGPLAVSHVDIGGAGGRLVLLSARSVSANLSNQDLVVYDLESRQSSRITDTPAEERSGVFSPGDSGWIAYVSDDTGQREVYVRPLSPAAPPVRVSTMGGDQPRWRADGRELVYLAPDGTFMSVPTRLEAASFSEPRAIFRSRPFRAALNSHFDMSPDGQRFIVELEPERPQPLVLIENWPALLSRR